jgi:choline dehydrogenase-like flavoprotein
MNESADVVVIGSGIAGVMCAWRLASNGLKVIVLEAGPRVERADIVREFTKTYKFDLSAGFPNVEWAPRPDWSTPRDDYIRQTGPDIARTEYLRIVGGTTWHWTSLSIRMIPSDFRLRSTYGVGVDWPIEYDDLEPYYLAAEREMGVSGDDSEDGGSPRSAPYPLPAFPPSYSDRIIADRLARIGSRVVAKPAARNSRAYDGRPQCAGFGVCSPICPTAAQYSADVHVAKAESLGVRIIENARVDRIEAAADGQITAVHFGRPDGSSGSATGRIFVLAANGIESPRLLLASATDSFPHGIANRSDQVGRNFMDHPGIYIRMLMPEPVYVGRGPDGVVGLNDNRDGEFRRTEAAYAVGLYNRLHLHDIMNHYLSVGLQPPELDRAVRDHALRQIEIDTHLEQLPQQNNRVTIDWSDRDSAGQPRIVLNYAVGEYEKRAFASNHRLFDKFIAALGAREFERSGYFSHHHLMGTLWMGRDARMSVVDSFCRAHDHANLFVAGSAVFPTGGTANPTLTIAALALRTGDAIVRQLRT